MAAPVSASASLTTPDKWFEIFHSKPSMKHCYLLEKLPSGEFTDPSPLNELVDASHIREGFRVIRLPARRIEFALTNGTARRWEDNNGANYVLDSVPGRYVVEHGIRRVGDTNAAECVQAALRTDDEYIQLEFRADLWQSCFCSYQGDGDPWTPAPGVEMTSIEKTDMQGKFFQIEVKAKKLECAFNDGGDTWDSNMGKNYRVGHPGKFAVADGQVHYVSPAEKDKEKPVSPAPGVPVVPLATAVDPVTNGAPVPTVSIAQ